LLGLWVALATGTPAATFTPAPEKPATAGSGASVAPGPRAAAPAPAAAHGSSSSRRPVSRPVRPDTARVSLEPSGGGAFVAYPPGTEDAPGAVVVHEWWGLNLQIREVARRLARQGYVVIVPDLYGGQVASDPETAHVLVRGLDEDASLAILESASRWLAADPRSASRRHAVLGFCMGGQLALTAALRDSSCSAVVMFYGTPEPRAERLAPLTAPLLGHFGADDQGIAVERVEAFERTLMGAGKVAEIHVYPGAGHAFMNEEQPGYRPEAARLAWVRTLDFLQKHVKGRRGPE